jgi:hypothetical protein
MPPKWSFFQRTLANDLDINSNNSINWCRLNSRKVYILLATASCFFLLVVVFNMKTPEFSAFTLGNLVTARQAICKPYSPLYTDAVSTHDDYILRGGIFPSDLVASKAQCDVYGQCLQIKLYDMNLYVGNVSNCFQSRGESLLMNLERAVEQARMEGEILPNFDVYLSCEDKPEGWNPWNVVYLQIH